MAYLPQAKRPIDLIVIHCTATHPYQDIGVKEIDRWHKGRGWSGIGYHGVIRQSGKFERGRNIETLGAHARGHNAGSIGIALVGGLGDDGRPSPDFKRAQWSTLRKVVDELRLQYPNARFQGHNELGPKACPSFDLQAWLANGDVKRVS